jgi:uncharacterized protein (DUF934 family)
MNAQLEQTTLRPAELVTSGTITPSGRRLVSADEWHADSNDGLLLSGDAEPEARFAHAKLIAIEFPAFTDGRGLSLAVLLRTRFGFLGELRAVGDVRADMLHYLHRCGFDSYLMSDAGSSVTGDGRTHSTGFNTLAPYSDYYQASVREPQPAHRRIGRGA